MAEVNLLESTPKVVRDVRSRARNKQLNREVASRFGHEYFDGTRDQGYGGYVYDGRWVPVARKLIDHFDLRPGDRVLDIGCAKGFLMRDLIDLLPGLEVWGLDISTYALRHAHPESVGRLVRGTCDALPFPSSSFSAAVAINTVHNLETERCHRAIREIERVAPGAGFIQVDAYRNDAERDVFEDWMLTAKTYLRPEEWTSTFSALGYTGDYFWTILDLDPDWTRTG